MSTSAVNDESFIGQLIPEIKKKLEDGKLSKSIEVVFFEVLAESIKNNSKYSFIKYINIWNKVDKNALGHIEFYAEFIHTKEENEKAGKESITNSREKINAHKDLFNQDKSIPISVLLRKAEKFGASFEYHLRAGEEMVMNNPYSTIYNENNKSKKFHYDPDLKKIIGDKFDLSEKRKLTNWLKLLQHCYKPEGDDLTHFFFLNGPIYYGRGQALENDLLNYVLYANVGVKLDNKNDLGVLKRFIRQFKHLIEQISFNLIVDIKDYQMRQTAVSASIAQVMARNLSHNIGSHVYSHLIHAEVYDKLTDAVIQKLHNYLSQENEKVFEHKEKEDPKSPLKNLQLNYFNQYLKSRMDYLSEVTFGVPTMLTSKMIYHDVFKELDRVRLLLNYISGISEFTYKFNFQRNNTSLNPERTTDEKANDYDFAVAFPSDVLGCQAFYNIIENIIRNTAKHAKKDNTTVTFSINFKDIDPSSDPELCDIEDIHDLFCVEIDNGIPEKDIETLVQNQKDRINASVLDDFNKLRNHSLGLLEMEASAAFLRQIDMPEIESNNYNVDDDDTLYHTRNGKKRLNILKPFKTESGALGYRFFIQKPKEFVFVGEWGLNDQLKERLRNFGIDFYYEKEFCEAMRHEKPFSHQFLIYKNTISDSTKEILKPKHVCNTLLPLRKIEIIPDEMSKFEELWQMNVTAVLPKLKAYAWEKWVGNEDISIESEYNNESKKQIVFLDHSDNETHENYCNLISEQSEAWIENMTSRTYGKLPGFFDYPMGKKNKDPLKNYIYKIQNSDTEQEKRIRQELFEAYHNKVIILDERVQKHAHENKEGSAANGEEPIPCWRLFRSTNVHIPRLPQKNKNSTEKLLWWGNKKVKDFECFTLDPNDFGDDSPKVENYVKQHLKKSATKAFILVHYGVLERMYNGDKDKIKDTLTKWANNINASRVVVTSGRGAHSIDLPDSVCFVNLSSVLYACNENRNKFLINYLINQARRKRK